MLVINRTLGTSGTNATDNINWGGRAVCGGVLVATAGTQMRDSLEMIVQGLELLQYDAFRHTHTKVLYQTPRTTVLHGVNLWKLNPPALKGRQ
jgi:hypothetical protein